MTTVTIREVFQRTIKNNPVSNHEWVEHGPTTAYQVVGAAGVHSKHKSSSAAEKARLALQGFYNKFNL